MDCQATSNETGKITGNQTVSTDYYYNLGHFQRTISTESHEALVWFNRGLVWTYAFNHSEAVECFERAIVADSACGIIYWGLAYAHGPHYNRPWNTYDEDERAVALKKAYDAAQCAQTYIRGGTAVEQALIGAIHSRYPQDHASVEESSTWNKDFADAMQSIYGEFADDFEVAAIYAEALLNLAPWKLWHLPSGKPTEGSRAIETKTILEKSLTQDKAMNHPGLLHMYIHLIEMSENPELGIQVAARLRGLVPDAGHLQHMPSHIDLLIGDYRAAMIASVEAIRADEKFFSKSQKRTSYTSYRVHHCHSLIYTAMFVGNLQVAMKAVESLESIIPEMLRSSQSPAIADRLESFLASRVHVMIRFGLWNRILDLELPKDRKLYCVTTTLMHYAKGVAWASLNNVEAAMSERLCFQESLRHVPPTRMEFPNKCLDILTVAEAMLDGELEYRLGNFEIAFAHLRRSVALDDRLVFNEPWGWMQPARHALAGLLLEQDRVSEAAVVYAADLGFDSTIPRARHHPNNVWALHGFHECLERLGRVAEARIIEPLLKVALQAADVKVESSCYCRRVCGNKPTKQVLDAFEVEVFMA